MGQAGHNMQVLRTCTPDDKIGIIVNPNKGERKALKNVLIIFIVHHCEGDLLSLYFFGFTVLWSQHYCNK